MLDPRNQFGPVAASYLTSAVHSNPSALERMVEVVKPEGGTLVDVATGAGHTAFAFAPYMYKVVATDITRSMLQVTREAAVERKLNNLQVAFAQAEYLPFQSLSVDGISCRMGAHHFESVPGFLDESHRALADGGWFLLVDTIGAEDSIADEAVDRLERLRDPSHRRNLRRSKWIELTERAGFTIEHLEESPKELDLQDWMDRMRVSELDQLVIRRIIGTASGAFKEYLQPEERQGRMLFHLSELLLFARKKQPKGCYDSSRLNS